jgi:osmoprotectant transport system permease protein
MRRPCTRLALAMSALGLPALALLALTSADTGTARAAEARPLVVGSKAFTESVILAEVAAQSLREAGLPATHRQDLGGSRILWDALRLGAIDVYPEYTGTIARELLSDLELDSDDAMRAALAERGLQMSRPLGFSNTYVFGVRRAVARELALTKLSDLRAHPALRFGFSSEFLQRGDGWPALQARYALPQRDVRGMEHQIAYRALVAGALDVTDLYSTDPEIAQYDLAVLEDDLGFFPDYRAVLLWRTAVDAQVRPVLSRLEGTIDTPTMARLNARATLGREPEAAIAASVVGERFGAAESVAAPSAESRFWRYTRQHLLLTGLSLAAAILLGLPLGILAAQSPALGRVVLGLTGLVQTVPALALLVFMIPLLGIGFAPACAALFLYSLLPIVRNTCAGLTDIPAPLRESATALGLPRGARLRHVELPLATRSILAGIKTAAVINVGTATLGALVGAGGYGEPIITGIRLNDVGLILQGAVPAALLAIAVQVLFDLAERRLLPRGLRLRA